MVHFRRRGQRDCHGPARFRLFARRLLDARLGFRDTARRVRLERRRAVQGQARVRHRQDELGAEAAPVLRRRSIRAKATPTSATSRAATRTARGRRSKSLRTAGFPTPTTARTPGTSRSGRAGSSRPATGSAPVRRRRPRAFRTPRRRSRAKEFSASSRSTHAFRTVERFVSIEENEADEKFIRK